MIDVWAELSKVYNMKGIPDEAMSIIGDLMLAWSDEQDTISRQAAIDCLCNGKCTEEGRWCDDGDCMPVRRIKSLPSAQPEIIRCRNCKFASGDSRICMKFDHSPIGELDFCAWAERRTDE